MDELKICILTETYYPVVGGGETQARLLAEGLAAENIPVFLMTRRSDAEFRREEQYGVVKVHRLPPVGGGQLKKWGLLFSSLPALIRLRNQYDLVFVSGFRIVGISAVLVSKLFGKTCVLKADSQGEMSGEFFKAGLARVGTRPSSPLFRLFLRLRNTILRRADAFSAITEDIAAELLESNVIPDAVHMIPNGVDTAEFFPVEASRKMALRHKLGIPPASKTAIYTGRLVSYKGLPLLLTVWREIVRGRQDALLLLVGTGGLDMHNCEDELRAYVTENNLKQNVCFTGSVDNVPEYLQASDIFVFPTENDAFPSSLIEAMTCELPVIATPVGAIKTIVENGKNGLLVEPGNFAQLLDALTSLMDDDTLADRLGKDGWRTVQERYSAEIVTKSYIDLFRSLSSRHDAEEVGNSRQR